jgi:predicted dehydrogenase
MKHMTVAIIGGGNFFNLMHGPVLSGLPGIGRAVHYNPDADQARANVEAWGFDEVYPTLADLLSNEAIDCVYVHTPPAATAHYEVQFIEAGIPAFLEKPIAEDPDSLHRINDAFSQYGTQHFVAFNRRHSPIVAAVKDFVDGANQVSHLAVDFYRHDTRPPNDYMGSAVHPIDTIRFLLGDIQDIHTVKSETEYFDSSKISYSSVFRFASGVTGTLNFNCRAGHVSERYTVLAENISVVAELTGPYDVTWPKTLKVSTEKGATVTKDIDLGRDLPGDRQTAAFFNGIEQEHHYFMDCLQSGGPMSPGIRETIGTMKTAYAIRQCYHGDLGAFQPSSW